MYLHIHIVDKNDTKRIYRNNAYLGIVKYEQLLPDHTRTRNRETVLPAPHRTTALHCTLHLVYYTTLHYTIHYTTLHYTTLHYTTLHYTTLHYTTLHYTTLHYTTLHCTPLVCYVLHYTTQYCIPYQIMPYWLHCTALRLAGLHGTHWGFG